MRCEHETEGPNGLVTTCDEKATYRVGESVYCDHHAAEVAKDTGEPSQPVIDIEDWVELSEEEIELLDPSTIVIGDMTNTVNAVASSEAWEPRNPITPTLIPPYVTPTNILIGGDKYSEWRCPLCETVLRGAFTPLGGAIAQHIAAHQYMDTDLGDGNFPDGME